MRASIVATGGILALAFVLLVTGRHSFAQQQILDFQIALVSDSVWRGSDSYREVYVARKEEESPVNIAPALQPSLTLYAPQGLFFNLWGSFALLYREEDNSAGYDRKGFSGLKTADELDTTIGFGWENRLGAFTVGVANYNYIHPDAQGDEGWSSQEMFVIWGLPIARHLSPAMGHHTTSGAGAYYTTFSVAGGASLFWDAKLGLVAEGVQDLTGGIGFRFGQNVCLSLNGAYRPVPGLHGYSHNGKYISEKDGSMASYPPAIFWFNVTYAGDPVTE